MGLENRDYYRDGSYTRSLAGWGIDFTPVVKWLIVVNVIVFLLQIFFTREVSPERPDLRQLQKQIADAHKAQRDSQPETDEQREQREEEIRRVQQEWEDAMARLPGLRVSIVQEWCELDPKKTIHQGQLWRLITCAFCHNRYSLWHLLFNMLALYWFGTRLERMYGPREFLLFYLMAAICGSLAFVGLAFYSGSNVPAIGASGAVMGVMMLYVIFYPWETFLLFWCIPVPLCILLALYVLYDLHPVLLTLAGDRVFTGIAHAGHLGGLVFGFLYWKFGLRLEAVFGKKWRGTWKAPRQRSRGFDLGGESDILPFEKPRPDPLADRVDAVLKKISETGMESLTSEERNVLVQASSKYREKK